MADGGKDGWGNFGQTGVSFQALITALQNIAQNNAVLLKNIDTSIKSLPVNVAPTYATGNWVPADNSGAGLTFATLSHNYTQVGRMIFAYAAFTYPVTADASAAGITGLPILTANAQFARGPSKVYCSASVDVILRPRPNSLAADFLNGGTGAAVTNAQLSGATVSFTLIYPIS